MTVSNRLKVELNLNIGMQVFTKDHPSLSEMNTKRCVYTKKKGKKTK